MVGDSGQRDRYIRTNICLFVLTYRVRHFFAISREKILQMLHMCVRMRVGEAIYNREMQMKMQATNTTITRAERPLGTCRLSKEQEPRAVNKRMRRRQRKMRRQHLNSEDEAPNKTL